jgi:hypothetical protein
MMHSGYDPIIARSMSARNLLRMTRWNLAV